MSDEQERARRFVERHFPVTARFLAEGGELPVYGPTSVQNVHDDQPGPHVIVRFDYRVSREELFAVFAAGYATSNTGQDPDAMPVEQIRLDVEGTLAEMSQLDLDRLVQETRRQAAADEHDEHMQALHRALDRAYPAATAGEGATADLPPVQQPEFAEEFPHVAAHLARERGEIPPVQRPEYGDGTVTLDTLDHGRITIDEPLWCTGHDGAQIVQRVDVTHVGVTVTGEYAGVEFLPACISWAPFAELRPEPLPLADVDEFPGMTPEELRELGAEVGLHAGRLYSKANELDRLRRAES